MFRAVCLRQTQFSNVTLLTYKKTQFSAYGNGNAVLQRLKPDNSFTHCSNVKEETALLLQAKELRLLARYMFGETQLRSQYVNCEKQMPASAKATADGERLRQQSFCAYPCIFRNPHTVSPGSFFILHSPSFLQCLHLFRCSYRNTPGRGIPPEHSDKIHNRNHISLRVP